MTTVLLTIWTNTLGNATWASIRALYPMLDSSLITSSTYQKWPTWSCYSSCCVVYATQWSLPIKVWEWVNGPEKNFRRTCNLQCSIELLQNLHLATHTWKFRCPQGSTLQVREKLGPELVVSPDFTEFEWRPTERLFRGARPHILNKLFLFGPFATCGTNVVCQWPGGQAFRSVYSADGRITRSGPRTSSAPLGTQIPWIAPFLGFCARLPPISAVKGRPRNASERLETPRNASKRLETPRNSLLFCPRNFWAERGKSREKGAFFNKSARAKRLQNVWKSYKQSGKHLFWHFLTRAKPSPSKRLETPRNFSRKKRVSGIRVFWFPVAIRNLQTLVFASSVGFWRHSWREKL